MLEMELTQDDFNELGKNTKSQDLVFLCNVLSPLFSVATFNVVIDTNIILQDLGMMANVKKNKPEYRTDIMECIEAGVFIAHITRQIEREVDEKIETRAESLKVSTELLRAEWLIYRKLLKKRKVSEEAVAKFKNPTDIDDIPTVILAKKLNAIIFTEDAKHLVPMGGSVVNDARDFSKISRDYSRQMAVSLWVEGNMVHIGSISVLGLFIIIKHFINIAANIPGIVKVVFIATIVIIAANPKRRCAIIDFVKDLYKKLVGLDWPQAFDLLSQIHKYTIDATPEHPTPQLR